MRFAFPVKLTEMENYINENDLGGAGDISNKDTNDEWNMQKWLMEVFKWEEKLNAKIQTAAPRSITL